MKMEEKGLGCSFIRIVQFSFCPQKLSLLHLFQNREYFKPKFKIQNSPQSFYLQTHKNAVTPVQLHASFQSNKQTNWIQYLDHRNAEVDPDFKYTSMRKRHVWHSGLAKIRTGPRIRFFQPFWNPRPCPCFCQVIRFSFSYIDLILAIWTGRSCPRSYGPKNPKRTSFRSERKILSHHFSFFSDINFAQICPNISNLW